MCSVASLQLFLKNGVVLVRSLSLIHEHEVIETMLQPAPDQELSPLHTPTGLGLISSKGTMQSWNAWPQGLNLASARSLSSDSFALLH